MPVAYTYYLNGLTSLLGETHEPTEKMLLRILGAESQIVMNFCGLELNFWGCGQAELDIIEGQCAQFKIPYSLFVLDMDGRPLFVHGTKITQDEVRMAKTLLLKRLVS